MRDIVPWGERGASILLTGTSFIYYTPAALSKISVVEGARSERKVFKGCRAIKGYEPLY